MFLRWLPAHSSVPASSVDKDLHRPRDAIHSDQEAGPPHAHPPGTHGTAGGRAPWQPVTDAAAGVPPVKFVGRGSWLLSSLPGQVREGSPNSKEGKYHPEIV